MFFNSTWSRRRIAAALVTNAFYICVFTLFAIGAYLWAFQVNRTQSLAINPVLYPQFTEVDTSELCCTSEPYYKLWRIYDWIADGYAVERHDREHIRVPLIYIHGNGGSFFCARSLARFIYEANVRQRVKALHGYRQRVKTGVYEELEKLAAAKSAWSEIMTDFETDTDRYSNDSFTHENNYSYGSKDHSVWPTDGSVIASSVQRRVEHDVVHNEMPLLGVELFSVDFLEESNTQSGTVTIKEARYVNHSLHVLMHNFVQTYANVISSPSNDVAGDRCKHENDNTGKTHHENDDLHCKESMRLEEEKLEGWEHAHGKEKQKNMQTHSKPYPLTLVETEYINSICNHHFFKSSEETCLLARQLLSRFNTQDRVRAEVLRVKANGFWIWGESLGGAVSLFGALLSPQLVEGIVYVGTPLHYPPLLFNDLSSKLYSIIARAVLFHSMDDYVTESTSLTSPIKAIQNESTHVNDYVMESNMTVASERAYSTLEYNASPISLIDWLHGMQDEMLSSRMSSITMLSINGGALDDVIPSTASYLHRSTPRRYPANATWCTSPTLTTRKAKANVKNALEEEELCRLNVFDSECFMKNTHQTHLQFPHRAMHRDISTEVLRGCGLPMDHRGVVYGSQFLETSANSLVDAALLPHANAHFAFERELPELHRDRLFASVTETLPEQRQAHQNAAFEFARKLEWKEDIHNSTETTTLIYHNEPNSNDWVNVCTDRSYAIDWRELVNVTLDGKQTYFTNANLDNNSSNENVVNGFETTQVNEKFTYYDGSVPLDVFLGVSTYDPEELYMPSLHFYYTKSNGEVVEMNETYVVAKAVSKLHLPFLRKDGKPREGQTLRTAVSFHVSWNATELIQQLRNTDIKIWPQFCFRAKTNDAVTSSSTRSTLTQHQHYSFVQYNRIDPRLFVHLRRPLHLGPMYMGNAVRVEKHRRFVLVDGVDSTMQERKLSVRTWAMTNTKRTRDKVDGTIKSDTMRSNSAPAARANNIDDLELLQSDRQHTFPVTLCGSLHSFYLAMRGNDEVAYDEPLEQLQYFFGPFDSSVETFHYSWQPHRTYPWNWNETYIVYTINDMRHALHEEEPCNNNEKNCEVEQIQSLITLHDFERLASLPIWSPARIMLLVSKWPEQLLAFFSANSEIGKLGGSYIIYYFCLLLLTGVPEEHFYINTSLWNARHSTWRLLQWLYNLHPFTRVTIYAVLFELMSSAWVSYALSICTSPELQTFTLEQAERWMDWKEKITLLLFYGVWPDARTCRYSWIRMQTIDEGPTLLCKVMSLYVGFCVAALLMTIVYAGFRVIRTIAYAFHRNITKPLILYWPKWGMLWLTFMWLTPFALFFAPMICTSSFASPWPLSYLYVFTTCWAHGLLSIVPVETAPGYNFQWPCTLLCLGSLASAHFEGLILTIRNQIQLHQQNADDAFWDRQRQAVTLYESVLFVLIQFSLATVYLTCFYVTQHDYAIRVLGKRKKENMETTVKSSRNANTNIKVKNRSRSSSISCGRYAQNKKAQFDTTLCCSDTNNVNTKTNSDKDKRDNTTKEDELNYKKSLKINGNGNHSHCHNNRSDEKKNHTHDINDNINMNEIHEKKGHRYYHNSRYYDELNDHITSLCTNTTTDNAYYTLGELNRKHQTFSNLLHITEKITLILLLYTTLVVMRRPLEGDIAQLDFVFHLFYLSCFVLRRL